MICYYWILQAIYNIFSLMNEVAWWHSVTWPDGEGTSVWERSILGGLRIHVKLLPLLFTGLTISVTTGYMWVAQWTYICYNYLDFLYSLHSWKFTPLLFPIVFLLWLPGVELENVQTCQTCIQVLRENTNFFLVTRPLPTFTHTCTHAHTQTQFLNLKETKI